MQNPSWFEDLSPESGREPCDKQQIYDRRFGRPIDDIITVLPIDFRNPQEMSFESLPNDIQSKINRSLNMYFPQDAVLLRQAFLTFIFRIVYAYETSIQTNRPISQELRLDIVNEFVRETQEDAECMMSLLIFAIEILREIKNLN